MPRVGAFGFGTSASPRLKPSRTATVRSLAGRVTLPEMCEEAETRCQGVSALIREMAREAVRRQVLAKLYREAGGNSLAVDKYEMRQVLNMKSSGLTPFCGNVGKSSAESMQETHSGK